MFVPTGAATRMPPCAWGSSTSERTRFGCSSPAPGPDGSRPCTASASSSVSARSSRQGGVSSRVIALQAAARAARTRRRRRGGSAARSDRDRRDVAGQAGRERGRPDRVARARSRRDRARAQRRGGGELRVSAASSHRRRRSAASVAVCDVGGGSTQLAVGSRDEEPVVGAFARSRLSSSHSPRIAGRSPDGRSDRPCARREIEPLFAALTPPLPHAAYATGGSARALGKIVGPSPRPRGARPSRCVSSPNVRRAGSRRRSTSRRRAPARSRPARCCSRRRRSLLGVPLQVARAGLREGVALSLLADAAVAA